MNSSVSLNFSFLSSRKAFFDIKLVNKNTRHQAGHRWLTPPVILATQEVEIRRLTIWSSLANSSRDPISKIPITKKGWWSGSRWRPWVQTSVLKKKKKNRQQKKESVQNNYWPLSACFPLLSNIFSLPLFFFNHLSHSTSSVLCCFFST
jgi:hypothetical protein